MQIFRGKIVACDASNHVYRYLVEDRGRIAFVGNELPDRYAGGRLVELGGKALVPAFVDTHIHFSAWSFFAQQLYLGAMTSFDDLQAAVKSHAEAHTDKMIIGFGVSAHNVKERRLPAKSDLDRWCPDHPLLLVKHDGHAAVANSAMLAAFPPHIRALRGYDGDTGNLNYEAFFSGTDFAAHATSPLRLVRHMLKGVDLLARRGIGMIHNVEGVGFPRDLDVDLVRLVARGQRQPFQFRIFFQTMDVAKVLRRKLPRIGGCFATALDGGFGSADAALRLPYTYDPTNFGMLYYPDEKVIQFTLSAHNAGLQIQFHAIGDAAFEQAVKALSTVIKEQPRPDHRHGIIHACLTTPKGLETCAELGICIISQPAFLRWDQQPLEYLESILGSRARDISPHRTMLDLGIHVSGSSDAPCTWPDPIEGLYCACNHTTPGQSVSIAEALRMFTYEAAYMGFDEKERGSLEPGKYADMTLLNCNPLDLGPPDLRQLKTESLYLSGKPCKPAQGLGSMLFHGLVPGARKKKI